MPLEVAPLTLVMKNKENMYFETHSARNTASLLNLLNLFIGIPSALLPSFDWHRTASAALRGFASK